MDAILLRDPVSFILDSDLVLLLAECLPLSRLLTDVQIVESEAFLEQLVGRLDALSLILVKFLYLCNWPGLL